MPLTVTAKSLKEAVYGDRIESVTYNVDFDSSYLFGGEVFAPNTVENAPAFSEIYNVLIENQGGYVFEWGVTNAVSGTIKPFAPAPPVVHEEYVTVTSNVGYLKYPAAHINYIVAAAANYIPIAGGLIPATGQCAVDQGFNDTTGVLTKGQRTSLTFLAGDSVTVVYVSYVTQAWKDVTENMSMAKMTSGVETYGDGLAFAEGTPDVVTLGTDICAMQSITWSDAGTFKTPLLLKDGAGPVLTTEMEVDFVKATTFAEVNSLAADAVDTAGDIVRYVYIKMPATGSFLKERFTNAEITDSTNDITFTGIPLMYGHCGQMPIETPNQAGRNCILVKVSDTPAAGEAQWSSHPWFPGTTLAAVPILTMHDDVEDDLFPAWIDAHPSELQVVPLEVPNATDLSELAGVRVTVTGRVKI